MVNEPVYSMQACSPRRRPTPQVGPHARSNPLQSSSMPLPQISARGVQTTGQMLPATVEPGDSSTMPLQLSSTMLQVSDMLGQRLGFESSQSSPVVRPGGVRGQWIDPDGPM